MKDYEFKISQFIDNELQVEEQIELFQFLSKNNEARETLLGFINLKQESKSFYSGMNNKLNENMAIPFKEADMNRTKEKKRPTLFYYSAVASILFAFLLLWQFNKTDSLAVINNDLQKNYLKLQQSNKELLVEKIEFIKLNNSYAKELSDCKQTENNRSISTIDRAKKKDNVSPKSFPKVDYAGIRLVALQNTQTVEITKNDFLGGQIIGN